MTTPRENPQPPAVELPPEEEMAITPYDGAQSLIMSDRMKEQLALALPKSLTPDRMVRVALTAINKTPKLMNCSQQSLLASIMTCAELGLEPDGRRAHLIPYGTDCQLIIGYKGLAELAMRSWLNRRTPNPDGGKEDE